MKKSQKPSRARSRAARDAAPSEKARAPTYDDLLAIVRLIESGSRFSEFRLRSGDIEVEVMRPNGAGGAVAAPAPAAVAPTTESQSTLTPVRGGTPEPLALAPDTQLVRAPMVGTFYRAPEPTAPPFVEVGTRVKPETIICIIEVMKLMNSIPAGVAGVVTQVFVGNAEPVEFGQPLIGIKRE